MPAIEFTIKVPQGAERVTMLGLGDRNLKILRETLGVRVAAREESVQVSGEKTAVSAARAVLEHLGNAAVNNEHLSRQQVVDLIGRAMAGGAGLTRGRPGAGIGADGAIDPLTGPAWGDHLDVYVSGKPIRAQTVNQQKYLDAMRDHDMVFGIGPAGTGKTYLAVAVAVHLLRAERTRKIILVRPAVEAGERLGFLPGDLREKVNPYLRPLLDALHDMMDFSTIKHFMFNDVVEVIPLAYMRGRTLNNATIILDEAQNTTRGQMQMFLTRMGHGSKMIVTGDVSQIDLPDPTESGLVDAVRRLRRVNGIGFCTLTQADIVRHPLVQKIVEAYGPAPVQSQATEPWTGDHSSLFPREGGGSTADTSTQPPS
jgi:phosphate starvation-inducible PhoH-like protein